MIQLVVKYTGITDFMRSVNACMRNKYESFRQQQVFPVKHLRWSFSRKQLTTFTKKLLDVQLGSEYAFYQPNKILYSYIYYAMKDIKNLLKLLCCSAAYTIFLWNVNTCYQNFFVVNSIFCNFFCDKGRKVTAYGLKSPTP